MKFDHLAEKSESALRYRTFQLRPVPPEDTERRHDKPPAAEEGTPYPRSGTRLPKLGLLERGRAAEGALQIRRRACDEEPVVDAPLVEGVSTP